MRRLLWMVCVVGVPLHGAEAQGIPTYDNLNTLQAIQQTLRLAEQVQQAKEAYEKQLAELQTAIEQRDALLGSYGAGNLLNGDVERKARRYVAGSWMDTLTILDGGGNPLSSSEIIEMGGNPGSLEDIKRIYAEREKAFQIAKQDEVGLLGPEDPTAVAAEYNRRSTLASQAVAETAYSRANGRVATYEELMAAIESSAPNSKASADLANRIAAENGLTFNEAIRVLSTLLASESAEKSEDQVARAKMERRFGANRDGVETGN